MTAWVLWAWEARTKTWNETRAGSRERMETLVDQRHKDAAELNIPDAKYVALPTGQRPDDSMIPGTLPLAPVPVPLPAEYGPGGIVLAWTGPRPLRMTPEPADVVTP